MREDEFAIHEAEYFIERGCKYGLSRADLNDIRRALEAYFDEDQSMKFNEIIKLYNEFDRKLFGLLDEILVRSRNNIKQESSLNPEVK